MGGSKPGFYQASPVAAGGIMGKERSSIDHSFGFYEPRDMKPFLIYSTTA